MTSDVLVIGGGVIGLSIAREFHKKGLRKIAILERGKIGKESSYAAAGMLSPNVESEKIDNFYLFCSESNKLYPNFAAELFDETAVDIEYECRGTLYLAFNQAEVSEIRRRFEWQKSAGFEVESLSAMETHKIEPFVSPNILESMFYPNDGQVENRQLLNALKKYCEINKIEFYENTEIENLLIENGKIIGAATAYEKHFAEKVILTTGAWTSFVKAENFTMPKVKPIRGQMISFQTAKRLFDKVIYSPRGYLVPRRDGRILIGATVEDVGFDKKVTDTGTEFLRETAAEIAPGLANLEIKENWAGLRPVSTDGLPILGEFSGIKNFFIATAHYRNGILLAPLTAKILTDKIVDKKESDYLKIYGLHRFQKARVSDISSK
ncbi:glycine oxidase ThiO [soil metagenome]